MKKLTSEQIREKLKKKGIKQTSFVKITKTSPNFCDNYDNSWTEDMKKNVGKIGIVVDTLDTSTNDRGIVVEIGGKQSAYPFWVLEHVENKESEIVEQSVFPMKNCSIQLAKKLEILFGAKPDSSAMKEMFYNFSNDIYSIKNMFERKIIKKDLHDYMMSKVSSRHFELVSKFFKYFPYFGINFFDSCLNILWNINDKIVSVQLTIDEEDYKDCGYYDKNLKKNIR